MSEIFDLFGDPVPKNRGARGRPGHAATLKNRNKVRLLLALGWSNKRIADTIGIATPTLREHYSSELKTRLIMRDRLVARMGEQLFAQVNEGSVSAIKEMGRFLERNDLVLAEAAFRGKKAKPKKAPRLGKKEQADIDAQTVPEGTSWASLLPN